MLYRILRGIAGIALRWYYAEIIVQGRSHIPACGPVLVVANHPNALVDALLVGVTLPRRVLLTAKATLFEHPLLAPLLGAIGVVPLRRTQDVSGAEAGMLTGRARNEDAFVLVTRALQRDGVVLVFPEGISHDSPSLAPMRSGSARIALRARAAGARGLHILPMGLVFEQKERADSRVLVRIGTPIDLDALCSEGDVSAAQLTRHIAWSLHAVTLNFATDDRAARAVRVARALAAMADSTPSPDDTHHFSSQVDLAARIERATERLEVAPPELLARADAFVARLAVLEDECAAHGVELGEVRLWLQGRRGAWLVFRDLPLLVIAGIPALLGWIAHRPPILAAQWLAGRSLRQDPSRDQPAMQTMVYGTCLMFAWYGALLLVAARFTGTAAAAFWLAVMFAAGQLELVVSRRLARSWSRARTFLALRRESSFRERLLLEAQRVLEEAAVLERALAAPQAAPQAAP